MGKIKRSKKAPTTKHDHWQPSKTANGSIKRRQHSNSKVNGTSGSAHKPKVPFSKHDRVLLVGEGDFSFTLSLVQHHATASIISTSFDDYDALKQKYPSIDSTLQKLVKPAGSNAHGTTDDWKGFSDDEVASTELDANVHPPEADGVIVLHSIDATSLSKAHRKALGPHAPFTKIVFNFPHTGGLSTDVNRQVRANQELLVGFFNSAKSLLATRARPAKLRQNDSTSDAYDEDENPGSDADEGQTAIVSEGRILVTLFEGEPYTLWNIRDLARHCALQVIESFKFPWSAYPEYKHARTIGDITKGQERNDGKRKGAWRGEERDARTYVLAFKDETVNTAGKRKRKPGGDSDDSD